MHLPRSENSSTASIFCFNDVEKMARSDDDGQAGEPLIEQLSDSDAPNAPKPAKRKRDTEEKQSAKRRKLKKPKDVDDNALDAEAGLNHAIAHMDTRLLADHVAQRTKRFKPELSLLESEECHVPGIILPLPPLQLRVPDDSFRIGDCRYDKLDRGSYKGPAT